MSGSNATSSAARQERPVSVPSLFFNHWRDTFDRLGWRDAADNLNRYLGDTGAEKVYSEKQIERMPPVMHRIAQNNTRFETGTFVGKSGRADVNVKLRSLQPGQSTEFDDFWDAPYSPKLIIPNAAEGIWNLLSSGSGSKLRRAYNDLADTVSYPSTYAAVGSFPLNSLVHVKAHRDGNRLRINGTVRHSLGDTFNFDSGQPGHAPGKILEDAGQAAPFPFRYSSEQDVEAEGEYGPGGITLKRATWGQRR